MATKMMRITQGGVRAKISVADVYDDDNDKSLSERLDAIHEIADQIEEGYGKVKLKDTSAAAYLKSLLDGKTISEKDGALYVRKLEGQTVTITEVNRLAGVKSNIQEQLDTLAGVKSVYGVFDTKAAMDADDGRPQEGQMALVRKDEDYGDRQTTYVFLKDEWEILAEVKFELRDFTEDQIDLEREVTGILPADNIDDAVALTENVLTREEYASGTEGVVKMARKLEGQTVTVEDLNYAGEKAHEHGNNDLLDSLTEAGDGTNFLADDGTYKKNAVKINPSSDNALEDTETGLKVGRQEILNAVLDVIYPIGSYAFGVKPTLGTWEEVTGDRALWLKNSVADGTTIAQQLPNITGDVAVNYISSDGYGALGGAAGTATTGHGAIRVDSAATGDANRRWPAGASSTGDSRKYPTFRFNASNSNSVYKDGANVQPNAYVMKVYKRTA